MNDEQVVMVYERCSESFEKRLNAILSEGGWRIASSHAYPCDSDFFAMLIKRSKEKE